MADLQEVAARRREIARKAMHEAGAVSARLLEVHQRAMELLGNEDTAVPEELGTRMRLIEQRMRQVELMMRETEDTVISAEALARGRAPSTTTGTPVRISATSPADPAPPSPDLARRLSD